jgi:hypothetical protein
MILVQDDGEVQMSGEMNNRLNLVATNTCVAMTTEDLTAVVQLIFCTRLDYGRHRTAALTQAITLAP